MVSPRRPGENEEEGLPLELAYATTVAKIQGRTFGGRGDFARLGSTGCRIRRRIPGAHAEPPLLVASAQSSVLSPGKL